MSVFNFLVIGVGGFIGAVVRYFISNSLNQPTRLLTGTLAVNLLGCLLIGYVFGSAISLHWTLFLASGIAGSLTTFSTLNKELINRWESGHKQSAVIYMLLSYSMGLLLTAIGYFIG